MKRVILGLMAGGLAASALAEPIIVVDIPPTANIIKSIDENAQVEVLLEPNHDAHHFALKPSQAKKLAEADYIFGIGSNFMPEFVEAAERAGNAESFFYYDDYIAEGGREAKILEDDPHYWLSPDHLNQMQQAFADELGANDYEKINIEINKLSPNIKLIYSHDAFGYFDDFAGVKSIGALHDLNDRALPAKPMAKLMARVEAGEVKCLLMEASEHSHDAEDLAETYDLEEKNFDLLGWSIESDDYFQSYFDELSAIYKSCE